MFVANRALTVTRNVCLLIVLAAILGLSGCSCKEFEEQILLLSVDRLLTHFTWALGVSCRREARAEAGAGRCQAYWRSSARQPWRTSLSRASR